MTQEQIKEVAECFGPIGAGLHPGASVLTRSFAQAALQRLAELIKDGHTAASHGKPKRGRRKKAETVEAPAVAT